MIATLAGAVLARPAAAKKPCKLLCAPTFSVSPSLVVTNVLDAAELRSLEDASPWTFFAGLTFPIAPLP